MNFINLTDARKIEFLDKLRELGGSAGNKTLRKKLGWSEDLYWRAKEELQNSGAIGVGRGNGGSVSIGDYAPSVREAEVDIYPPALEQIGTNWVKNKGFRHFVSQITAKLGATKTGGRWTRPDITLYTVRSFEFIPNKHIDVITFEIKAADQLNVGAVYEAVSHQKSATLSYVLFHADMNSFNAAAESQRIVEACSKHGVGLLIAEDISDFDTWNEEVDAARSSPDPAVLDQFVSQVFSDENKTKIRELF